MIREMTRVQVLGGSVGAAAILVGAPASATMFATSFERPEYTLGELDGQNDWYNRIGINDSFLVDDSMARTGNQSLRINYISPPAFGDYQSHARLFDVGDNAYFEMSGWFYMEPDVHHFERHVGFRMSGPSPTFGIDQLLGIAIDGAGRLRASTSTLGLWGGNAIVEEGRRDDILGRWIRMHLFADIASGDAIASWSGLGTSAGDSTVTAHLTAPLDRDFSAFNFIELLTDDNQGSSPPGQALMWMDDFTMRAFPSPGAVALFGIAGFASTRRRR